MVLACLVIGAVFLLPYGFLVLGQTTVAISVFASNIFFWKTTGYFDPAAEENVFLHTWSLAVEEQFYLCLPILLFMVFKLRWDRWLFQILSAILATSFLYSVYLLSRDPEGAYYLLPSRAWELGAGCLLAISKGIPNRSIREAVSVAGLWLIVAAFFLLDKGTPFPGVAATLPVVGAAFIIWAGVSPRNGDTLPIGNRILTVSPLVSIGLMSYSLYLIHWPFFAFHRSLAGGDPGLNLSIVYVVAAFILSLLSLNFVERPFRVRSLAPTRNGIFRYSLATFACLTLVGVLIWKTGGFPERVPDEVAWIDSVNGDKPFTEETHLSDKDCGTFLFGSEKGERGVVVLGDSHAGSLLPVIDKICKDEGIQALAAVRGGTPPVLNWSGLPEWRKEHKERARWVEAVMQRIRELTDAGGLKTVILDFRWSYYIKTPWAKRQASEDTEGFEAALEQTIAALTSLGVQVCLLEEVPIFDEHVPKQVALARWRGFPMPERSMEEAEQMAGFYEPLLESLTHRFPNLVLIDPRPRLAEDGFIQFQEKDGFLIYRDEHHLTTRGSMRLLPDLKDLIKSTSVATPRKGQ